MIIVFYIFWDENFCDKIVWYYENINNKSSIQVPEAKSVVQQTKKKCELNSYFACIFVTTVKESSNYQSYVGAHFSRLFHLEQSSKLRLKIKMYYPNRQIIDYKWSDILNHWCYEKRELDSAMAWLSTLGGAFSALGDHFDNCAIMAGRISIQQFRLALKLGEPSTIARCKLFYGISLIQRGRLKMAGNLVRKVYHEAKTYHIGDKRLQRMCLGIWTKLQYEWNKKYKRKCRLEND